MKNPFPFLFLVVTLVLASCGTKTEPPVKCKTFTVDCEQQKTYVLSYIHTVRPGDSVVHAELANRSLFGDTTKYFSTTGELKEGWYVLSKESWTLIPDSEFVNIDDEYLLALKERMFAEDQHTWLEGQEMRAFFGGPTVFRDDKGFKVGIFSCLLTGDKEFHIERNDKLEVILVLK